MRAPFTVTGISNAAGCDFPAEPELELDPGLEPGFEPGFERELEPELEVVPELEFSEVKASGSFAIGAIGPCLFF